MEAVRAETRNRCSIPAIRAANEAGIPIVLFNRPAERGDAHWVAVVADNYAISKATVEYMVEEARKTGRKHQAFSPTCCDCKLSPFRQ